MKKSKQFTSKPDVEALEEAATIIQREESRMEGQNFPDGAAAKAKSLADQAASACDEPNAPSIDFKKNKNKKASPELVANAQRTLQREEAKFYDGVTPPDGAATAAQSIASRVGRGENPNTSY